ncbi:MAG: nicotinate phosphoribosyltransferase [Phormidesmis sp. RL_2_1]|nr:nicotinate phosphoribosyltransferase [Phormidesmis sp. RL_2_1]
MTFFQTLNSVFNYLAEGFYRIFSPHDDAYPATGIQPYAGTPYSKRTDDW